MIRVRKETESKAGERNMKSEKGVIRHGDLLKPGAGGVPGTGKYMVSVWYFISRRLFHFSRTGYYGQHILEKTDFR